MPRDYKRITEINSYTLGNLQNALQAIRYDGRKIREVGRCFGIPESTLRKQLLQNQPAPPRLGRKPIFKNEVETELKDYILTLAKLFYGLTPNKLRRLAFNYAEENKIPHNFNRDKGLAGKDWLYGFLNRNPEVSLRQPEGTSLNRIASFNVEETKRFYSNLQKIMETFIFKSKRIFNVDETGITTVQNKCPKVYGPKGLKKVGAAISAERGRTITAVFCMSAAGNYIPPMLIYARKRMTPTLQNNGPICASYQCSKNGWINAELFLEWLFHFKMHAKPTETDPILLVLDNHSSHISMAAYDFCKQNYIHMVSLPPHTSDHLQPLDLTFFSPLKSALYREYDLYLTNTGHEKITEYNVAELLNKSFMKIATMEKAVSGFRSAGIFPLNPDKFGENHFAPANELRQLIVEGTSEPIVSASAPESQHTSDFEARPPTNSKPNEQHAPPVQDPKPSTSKSNSYFTIAPIAKKKSNGTVRTISHEKQHSEILTSSPIKRKLEKAEEKKRIREEKKRRTEMKKKTVKDIQDKKNKGRKKVKKQLTTESSDDDELDDTDFYFLLPENDNNSNEFCCICGEKGKDKELWYRCVLCSSWNHAECTGEESPKDYVCDVCLSGK